jgi:hypothetical protein
MSFVAARVRSKVVCEMAQADAAMEVIIRFFIGCPFTVANVLPDIDAGATASRAI